MQFQQQPQQQIVDPFGGVKQGVQTLAEMTLLGQRDRALDQNQQRVDIDVQKADQENELLPFKYMQAKIESGLQFLPGLPQEKYPDFHKWATEVPLDKKRGLGTVPRELLTDPEVVKSWTPEEYTKNKQNWFVSGKQLAERETAQFKADLERGLSTQRAGQERDAMTQRGQLQNQELGGRKELLRQEGELSGVKHQNALDLEAAKTKTAAGLTQSQIGTERQRMRSQISKLWGQNEFSKLDDDAAKDIEDATLRASRYWEDGEDFDASISKANSEVRTEKAVKAIPRAQPGMFGNQKQTQTHVQKMMESGLGRESVGMVLKQKGWDTKSADDIMDKAGLYVTPGASPAVAAPEAPKAQAAPAGGQSVGQSRFKQTATNKQTGQRMGLTEDGKWVPIR